MHDHDDSEISDIFTTISLAASTFRCPETFPNGRVGPECDRYSGSSCIPLCDEGFESAVGSLTCGIFADWNYPTSSICRGNLCMKDKQGISLPTGLYSFSELQDLLTLILH